MGAVGVRATDVKGELLFACTLRRTHINMQAYADTHTYAQAHTNAQHV